MALLLGREAVSEMAGPCLAPRSPVRHRPRRQRASKAKVEWVADLVAHDLPQPAVPDYLVDAIHAAAESSASKSGASAATHGVDDEMPAHGHATSGDEDTALPAQSGLDLDDDSPMSATPPGVDVEMMDVEDEALGWIPPPASDGQPVSPVSEPDRDADADRARTLIVLDYDDTLFPTTELRRLGYTTTVTEDLPDEEVAEIREIEDQAIRLVELCSQYGSVILLTNAEGRWLRLSTSSYMPRLHKQLELFSRTVYGREFSETCPDDPGKWKELALRDVLHSVKHELRDDQAIRLVSVGDSTFERQAAKDAGADSNSFGNVEVKTVKMMDLPTFSLLKRQLEVLCLALAPILDQRGPMDVEVACNDSEQAQAVDDGRPSSDAELNSASDTGSPAEEQQRDEAHDL